MWCRGQVTAWDATSHPGVWLLSCHSGFPLRHTLGGCGWWLKFSGSDHQHGRLRELWLLASAWSSPDLQAFGK